MPKCPHCSEVIEQPKMTDLKAIRPSDVLKPVSVYSCEHCDAVLTIETRSSVIAREVAREVGK